MFKPKWNKRRAARIAYAFLMENGRHWYNDLSNLHIYFNPNTLQWNKYCGTWHKRFCTIYNKEMSKFFVEDFLLPGHAKVVEAEPDGWHHFIFSKI